MRGEEDEGNWNNLKAPNKSRRSTGQGRERTTNESEEDRVKRESME